MQRPSYCYSTSNGNNNLLAESYDNLNEYEVVSESGSEITNASEQSFDSSSENEDEDGDYTYTLDGQTRISSSHTPATSNTDHDEMSDDVTPVASMLATTTESARPPQPLFGDNTQFTFRFPDPSNVGLNEPRIHTETNSLTAGENDIKTTDTTNDDSNSNKNDNKPLENQESKFLLEASGYIKDRYAIMVGWAQGNPTVQSAFRQVKTFGDFCQNTVSTLGPVSATFSACSFLIGFLLCYVILRSTVCRTAVFAAPKEPSLRPGFPSLWFSQKETYIETTQNGVQQMPMLNNLVQNVQKSKLLVSRIFDNKSSTAPSFSSNSSAQFVWHQLQTNIIGSWFWLRFQIRLTIFKILQLNPLYANFTFTP